MKLEKGDKVMLTIIAIIASATIGIIVYGIWFSINDPGRGTITSKHYHPMQMTCSGKHRSIGRTVSESSTPALGEATLAGYLTGLDGEIPGEIP